MSKSVAVASKPQLVATFNLDKGLELASKGSVRLFSLAKSEDCIKAGITPAKAIREKLKLEGLKGEQLKLRTREMLQVEAGKATVAGKTMEAQFESKGGQITAQRVAVTATGNIKLTSVRSMWTPQTPEAKRAALVAKKAHYDAEIKKFDAEQKTLDIVAS